MNLNFTPILDSRLFQVQTIVIMSLFPLILPNIELTFKNKTYNLINAKMLYWEVQSTKDIYEQTNGH